MASENVYEWIEKHEKYVKGDILEVGSRRYKEHAFLDLRGLSENLPKTKTFLGCDISDGENVDVITDLTKPFNDVHGAFGNKKFDTIFCISVLEHIPDVFSASKNITALLNPGGALFISVPFVFRYHGYPGDLWRFTPEAIKFLFPDIDFKNQKYSLVSTLEHGETMPLSNNRLDKLNRFLFRPKSREAKLERKKAKTENGNIEPYTLAPSMINMLGFKPK